MAGYRFVALATLRNGNETVVYRGSYDETREEVMRQAKDIYGTFAPDYLPGTLKVLSVSAAKRAFPQALRIFDYLNVSCST